ncbi:hypothetical protein BQ8794_190012 [Mesorhizobium prunaredense]|uniref:Uncharacterized protein n=1 Tax=Mesorhizobium prunaredense TaxID=1631249 RepID=A0A1R3V4S7_9HYPH|nr:hypothetical protein BQ8794_190012 [Mesorhizobium prunaredense]
MPGDITASDANPSWNHYGGRYCDKTIRIVIDHVRQMNSRTAEDPTLIYSKTAASPNLLGLSRHSHSIVFNSARSLI